MRVASQLELFKKELYLVSSYFQRCQTDSNHCFSRFYIFVVKLFSLWTYIKTHRIYNHCLGLHNQLFATHIASSQVIFVYQYFAGWQGRVHVYSAPLLATPNEPNVSVNARSHASSVFGIELKLTIGLKRDISVYPRISIGELTRTTNSF